MTLTRRNLILGGLTLGFMATTRITFAVEPNVQAPNVQALSNEQLFSAWVYWLYQKDDQAIEQAEFFQNEFLKRPYSPIIRHASMESISSS